MNITATQSWVRWECFISSARRSLSRRAVGQAGQRIVVGLHPDQRFGLLAVGDVGDHADQAAEAAV